MCKTPFEAFYAPLGQNQLHIFSIPTVTANSIYDEITGGET